VRGRRAGLGWDYEQGQALSTLPGHRHLVGMLRTEPLQPDSAALDRETLRGRLPGGQVFRITDGLPLSMSRELNEQSWFEFAQRYADMKWPHAAAKSRAGNADALASATFAMLPTDRGRPADAVLRRAMTGWAFNPKRRDTVKPADIERALKWLASNTVPVSRLDDPATLRRVLDQLALKMDGKPAAAKTFSRKRAVI